MTAFYLLLLIIWGVDVIPVTRNPFENLTIFLSKWSKAKKAISYAIDLPFYLKVKRRVT